MADSTRDPRAAIARYVERAYQALDATSYYQMLGVPEQAGAAEIKGAYYRLASRLHPDLHGEWMDVELKRKLTAVYSRIVEAYKVLTHGERREQYDAGLASGKLRWDADAGARPKIRRSEDQVPEGAARKFFVLGRDALERGNASAAVMNLKLSLSMAPGNDIIIEHLARAEALAAGRGTP